MILRTDRQSAELVGVDKESDSPDIRPGLFFKRADENVRVIGPIKFAGSDPLFHERVRSLEPFIIHEELDEIFF